MDAFTYMSDDAVDAVIKANENRVWNGGLFEPTGYAVTFSMGEFQNFVRALQHGYNFPPSEMPDDSNPEEFAEWCGQFLSTIAETLGVEFV